MSGNGKLHRQLLVDCCRYRCRRRRFGWLDGCGVVFLVVNGKGSTSSSEVVQSRVSHVQQEIQNPPWRRMVKRRARLSRRTEAEMRLDLGSPSCFFCFSSRYSYLIQQQRMNIYSLQYSQCLEPKHIHNPTQGHLLCKPSDIRIVS